MFSHYDNNHGKKTLPAQCAFSLVEVILAIGVISICLVTVMGVIPAGLKTIRAANDETVQSQILMHMSARISLTGFSRTADEFDGKRFYFDEQGLEQGASDTETRFWANSTVKAPVFPGSAEGPVSGSSALEKQYLTVKLDIITAPSAAAVIRQTNTFIIPVPNLGN